MYKATSDARNEELIVDEELHHRIKFLSTGVEHSIEFLRLRHGSGETIKDEPVADVSCY